MFNFRVRQLFYPSNDLLIEQGQLAITSSIYTKKRPTISGDTHQVSHILRVRTTKNDPTTAVDQVRQSRNSFPRLFRLDFQLVRVCLIFIRPS